MSLEERWREEKESAWLYVTVASAEPDEAKSRMFAALSQAAEEQAGIIAREMEKAGQTVPEYRPSTRARIVAALTRMLGPRRIRRVLAAMKVRGVSVYTAPAPVAGHRMPASVEEVGLGHGGVGGGNLRAAVFGANDGLVSNASLITGVAGATADPEVVLLTGIAGLLAGAFSMAAGEYVSVRSQRELYEHQIRQEREELAQYPEEEAEELALIYSARGIPMEQAREMAGIVFRDPDEALRVLSLEELGINPDDLGSPWGAAISSFVSFAAGALLPLLPFLVHPGSGNLAAVAAVTGLGLFGMGAAISLFSGKHALAGGLRMLMIGGGAGVATYIVGKALGVSLG
ncbi:MAG: hypothetical protein D6815_06325 [Candidatus Dadabacteria bacterium]|nr:MAG: hypothetical protein D6815_06325 [Candidatus Dadabacteria bacterium]